MSDDRWNGAVSDDRWVIAILGDDDVPRFYTGLRDENGLRVYADTPDNERTLRYAWKSSAMNDIGLLLHDRVRAWLEDLDRARRHAAIRKGVAARRDRLRETTP